MKRILAMLAAMLLMACPVLAEEAMDQSAAQAAFAAVLLENADYVALNQDDRILRDCIPRCFAVLDLDGDGMREVVVEITEPDGFIILTYRDGVVYGAEVPYRGLLELKDDGTFSYSNGAADCGVARMDCSLWGQDAQHAYTTYQIEAASVTLEDGSIAYEGEGIIDEASYQAFRDAQDAKLSALWYDYTEDKVKLLLEQ